MLRATEECLNPTVTEETEYNADGKYPIAGISRLCVAFLSIQVCQYMCCEMGCFSQSTSAVTAEKQRLSLSCFWQPFSSAFAFGIKLHSQASSHMWKKTKQSSNFFLCRGSWWSLDCRNTLLENNEQNCTGLTLGWYPSKVLFSYPWQWFGIKYVP